MKKAALDNQPVDLRSILNHHSPSAQQTIKAPAAPAPVLEIPTNPIINFVAPTPQRIHSPITFDQADVEDNKSTASPQQVEKFTPCKSKRSKLSVSFNNSAKKPYDKRHQSPPLLLVPGQPSPSTSSAAASYYPSNYYYMSSTSAFDPRMADHRNEQQTYPMMEYNTVQQHPQCEYQQYPADDYQDYEEHPAPYEDYQHNDSVEYPADFHGAHRHQSVTGNEYGNVIILDWCNPQKLRRSVEILSATALHHHLLMKFLYRKCERFQYVCSQHTIISVLYFVLHFLHPATARQNWSAFCRPLRNSRPPARNSPELWPAHSCWISCSSTAIPSNRSRILRHGTRSTLTAPLSKSIGMPM